MAYLAFQEVGGVESVSRTSKVAAVSTAAPVATLSPLEWSVVEIARKDGPSSLIRPGRIVNAIRKLFALRNPRLADSRLEALRRMAVFSWQKGYTVPPREVRAFFEAGFSADQYEAMVDRISLARIIPPRTAVAR